MRTLLLLLLSIFGLFRPALSAGTCQRHCLISALDDYVHALVKHQPSAVDLGKEIFTVENLQPIKPGEGLWKTVTAGPTSFRIVVPDPVSQSVGAVVMLHEGKEPIEVAIRLQLRNGQIMRADHLVARGLSAANLQHLVTPRPALLAAVPSGDRMSRDDLLGVAAAYYRAVEGADGSLAPFATDCVRRESGWQSTSNPPLKAPPTVEPGKPMHRDQAFLILGTYGCAAQLDTGIFANISGIGDRRIDIADPETGLVFAFSHFYHEFKQRIFKLHGVPGVDAVDWDLDAFDLYAAHILKIAGGRIHEIEATGAVAPYNSPTVW